MRSPQLDKLLMLLQMKEHIAEVSKLAFEAADKDNSGGLDTTEISYIMSQVATNMGVTPPTEEDLDAILSELDADFDGIVDKEEFLSLILLVIGKMLQSEQQT